MGEASIWVLSQAYLLDILVRKAHFNVGPNSVRIKLHNHSTDFTFLKHILCFCSEMGKGRHEVTTKEELIKKHKRIHKITQVDYHSHLFRLCLDALCRRTSSFMFFVSHPVFSPCFRNSRGERGFCRAGTSTA